MTLVASITVGTVAVNPLWKSWLEYRESQERLKEEDRITTIKKQVAYMLWLRWQEHIIDDDWINKDVYCSLFSKAVMETIKEKEHAPPIEIILNTNSDNLIWKNWKAIISYPKSKEQGLFEKRRLAVSYRLSNTGKWIATTQDEIRKILESTAVKNDWGPALWNGICVYKSALWWKKAWEIFSNTPSEQLRDNLNMGAESIYPKKEFAR